LTSQACAVLSGTMLLKVMHQVFQDWCHSSYLHHFFIYIPWTSSLLNSLTCLFFSARQVFSASFSAWFSVFTCGVFNYMAVTFFIH